MRFGKVIIPTDEMRKVLDLCVLWYSFSDNSCGGHLHVVTDDDNIDDGSIEFCRNELRKNKDPRIELGNSVLDGLLKLDEQQRMWVTYNIYNVKNGEGEQEIMEEFPDEYDAD